MQRTELIYLADPLARHARATVVAIADRDDGIGMILDRTPAYPQGGGQPSDVGQILGPGAAAFSFGKVIRGADGEVVHIGHAAAGAFKSGDPVEVMLDWHVRDLHQRLHTGGELICAAVDRLGYRWKVRGASHFPGQCRVAFQSDLAVSGIHVFRRALSDTLAGLIVADMPVQTCQAESPERLAELCPTEADKAFPEWPVRMVSPAPGFWRPCLGAHCSRTGEVGRIQLTKIRLRQDDLSVGYTVEQP